MIIFCLIQFLSQKKITKPNIFKKKTETEPKPVQTDRFRIGFFSLAWFWLGFFQFGFDLIFLVSGL
jgi:hypothetical protein